jgi:hypothetical protein
MFTLAGVNKAYDTVEKNRHIGENIDGGVSLIFLA